MIRFRPQPWASVFTLVGIVILLSLGKWQLDRLAWKLDLIAAVETRAHGPVVTIEEALKETGAREYRHVSAVGRFRPGEEVYLFSQLEDQRIGFQVIAPFDLVSGGTILVDRGFVDAAHKSPDAHAGGGAGQDADAPVTITGLLRESQPAGLFTPPPDQTERVFYGRDVDAMADLLGLNPAEPVLLAADGPGEGVNVPEGAPEGGHTRLAFKNDHLTYALTWFALAATLLGVYLAYHWQSGRLRLGRAAQQGE